MTVLVVAAGVAAVVPAGALVSAGFPAQSDTPVNGSNVSLGASVSAFMQASAAETRGAVDNRMFSAAFNRTDDKQAQARLVDARTRALEMRLERLRAERAALLNGSDDLTVAERAKAVRLAARIEVLQRAINQTDTAASRAGVDNSRLQTLRQNASELSGPEIAALAGGLVDNPGQGPPVTPGPPDERGESGKATGAPGTPGNGPPYGDPANATEVGNGSDNGNRSTQSDQGSNGSDGGSDEPTPTETETETADGQ